MAASLVDLQAVIGDRYQIDRELGRGGMATVYLAHDSQTDREVAVKVLHADLGMAMGADRFEREIHIASRLSHPHILPIEDFGGSGGTLYFVMPYVKGETLAARLLREGMLSVEEAVRITCQVASALEHAHQQGVIHRDVKPENILLDEGEARLADFGIARALSESGAERRLTQTGMTLGTPVYMSPEQAVAERTLDGRSDVYSLGCVLYEMLAGQPPFVGPTAQAIIARQMLEEVPSITVVRGAVPDEIEDAVLRALAKVPADRYATAREFAEALQTSMATAGRTLGRSDRRNRTRRRPGTRGRSRWRLPVAVAAVCAVLVGGGGAAWWRTARGEARTTAAGSEALAAERIGVLYFEDRSADSSLGPVADGLTEELITQLGAVNALDVVSRNGVARFRSSGAPLDSIATVLGTGTLVLGNVERRGGALRVVVRVVDGASGADAKQASFQVPASGLVAARDSVVNQVASFLRARIGEEVRMRETRRATTNDAAWSLSLQAERLAKNARTLAKANDTVGASRARRRADSLLVRATALDPAWPEPSIQRGRLALEELAVAAEPFRAQRWADSSMRAAEAALRVDPAHPGALALRGAVRLQRWRRHLEPDPRASAQLLAGAEADLKRATQLAPNDASAWSTLARVYYEKPDLVEATLAARRAYEKDAFLENADRMLWNLYTTAYDNESFLDAVKWCDEGRQRFPDNPAFVRCQLWLFTTNARAPEPNKAWQLVSDLQAITPRAEWAYLGREARMLAAVAIGKAGLKDSADRVLKQARADAGVDPERDLLGTEALMRELLGQRDEALVLLKQYLVAKPEHRSLYATSQSWWWRGMKTDARFRTLVGIAD